jgi:hypothetical protein
MRSRIPSDVACTMLGWIGAHGDRLCPSWAQRAATPALQPGERVRRRSHGSLDGSGRHGTRSWRTCRSSTRRGSRRPGCSTRWVSSVLYSVGVLAPNAPWRRAVVPPPREHPDSAARDGHPSADVAPQVARAPAERSGPPASGRRPKYRTWADLMRRTFPPRPAAHLDPGVIRSTLGGGRTAKILGTSALGVMSPSQRYPLPTSATATSRGCRPSRACMASG